MIKSISLRNFRGFREHDVEFTPFCLLIGQNNAGKTTIVEALRIVSAALSKAPHAIFSMAPQALEPHLTGPVYRFSLDTLDVEPRGIHYNYRSDEPALIRVRYSNNCQIVVAIGESVNEAYCQLIFNRGQKINKRSQFNSSKFRSIFVMPPVGALLTEETIRDRKYLEKHLNGYLSYRHIRNQMISMPSEFTKFKEMLSSSWNSSIQISDVSYQVDAKQGYYTITIRDGPFVSEMALVGSGLQAWIQTVWFLARVEQSAIIILDEPDVFLHADLQKKLIKLLSAERYRQTIVATHSLEMIADVSPAEIILVSKRSSRSRALSSSVQAQSVVESLGTNLNIQLSKVAAAGKIVFVEGKDYSFLDQIAFKMGNDEYDRFSKIPHFSIGGMNNWPRAAMASRAFYDTSGGKVEGVLFLDRDYKSEEVLDNIRSEGIKDHLRVVVWKRKEIENYFLCSDLIYSYLIRNDVRVEKVWVEEALSSVVDQLHSELVPIIADGLQKAEKGLAIPTAIERAKKIVHERVSSGMRIQDFVSGKRALALISERCQSDWKCQISAMSLCRHMELAEVPSELRDAVRTLI